MKINSVLFIIGLALSSCGEDSSQPYTPTEPQTAGNFLELKAEDIAIAREACSKLCSNETREKYLNIFDGHTLEAKTEYESCMTTWGRVYGRENCLASGMRIITLWANFCTTY